MKELRGGTTEFEEVGDAAGPRSPNVDLGCGRRGNDCGMAGDDAPARAAGGDLRPLIVAALLNARLLTALTTLFAG